MDPVLIPIPDSFETTRLIIRRPFPGDGVFLYEAIEESRNSLSEWLPFARERQTPDEHESNLRRAIAKFITREDLRLHVFDKHSNRLLGSSGLHRIDWNVRRFEIGYWLRDSAVGYGVMTEAVHGISEFARAHLGANRIEIRCDSANVRSSQVAVRCGYFREGVLRSNSVDANNTMRDTLVFAKIRMPDGTLGYPLEALNESVQSRPK